MAMFGESRQLRRRGRGQQSVLGSRSHGLRQLKAVLLAGTALSFGVLGFGGQANAGCVVNIGGLGGGGAPSPDTVVCTSPPDDMDGVSVDTLDLTGVNVTMQPGSALTNGAGTSMEINMLNPLGANNFNFEMNDPFSSITGFGDQVVVNSIVGGTHNWEIGGIIQSNGGDAIRIGFGAFGTVNMTVAPTGIIRAADDAITINSVVGGNFNLTNNGEISAGDDAIIMGIGAFGSMTVTNTGEISAGGDAISMSSLAGANMLVANDGQMTAGGDAIIMTLGAAGNMTVTNTGEISARSDGIRMSSVGAATMQVTNDGQMTAGDDAIAMVNVLGGTMQVDNTGVIGSNATPVGGSAVSMLGLSDAIVTNSATAPMFSAGNTIEIDATTASVANNGSLTSTGGVAINTRTVGTNTVSNSGAVNGAQGGIQVISIGDIASVDNTGGA